MNVTPLVDVVLVLLIIFMVVLPAMASDLNVELAKIENPDKDRKGEPDPYLLSIDAQGRLFMGEYLIPDGKLEDVLRDANAKDPRRRLVLRGDRRIEYEKVRELMKAIQDVGFPGVSLRVSKVAVDDAHSFAKSVHGASEL